MTAGPARASTTGKETRRSGGCRPAPAAGITRKRESQGR